MTRFLLAENPLKPEQPDLWIIHMLDPVSIIRCSEGHVVPPETIFRHYSFKNIDGEIENWTLSIYHFFTTDFLEQPEDRAPKILDRAWRWFRSYLEKQDEFYG